MIRRGLILAALVGYAIGGAAPSHGDTVLMHNGTMHYGEILETTEAEVVIKTKVANIVTTLRLKRAEIAEIDRPGFEVKDGFWEEKKPAVEPAKNQAGPSEFLVIPIKGGIGDAVSASGVAAALRAARERSVRHIVFDIDTPGGVVREATKMTEAIDEFRAAAKPDAPVRVHAYVRNAISAGIWVLFSCDDVFWAEAGTAGGAVAYHVDRSTGNAEVDAKMNSILAAQIASAAEQRGHPKHLVRAMMQQEASLYAWRTRDGRPMISDTAPQSGADVQRLRELDGPTGVLTLTTSDAIEIGFGRLASAGPAGIGAVLGIAGWASAGDDGIDAMDRAEKSAQRQAEQEENQRGKASEIRAEFQRRLEVLVKEAEAADRLHPLRSGSYRVDRNGDFIPASRAAWARNCYAAIEAYEGVLDGINELKRLDGRFQHLTGESLINKSGRKFVIEEIRETIKWIKDRKSASRP